MSKLLDVAEQLRELHAEVAGLESAMAKHRDSESLMIDYQSLAKRQRGLEAEFQRLADSQELDVLRYRLVPESGESVPLRALARVLDRFQTCISTVYDAVRSGPKQRAKLTAEIYAESGMDFGYTFSGSLGIALTVPNERMLLDRSLFDTTLEVFFSAATAKSRDDVVAFARRYGVAAVRRVYDWSAAHADFDMAADISVTRGAASRSRLQVAPRSLRELKLIIEETSDTLDQPDDDGRGQSDAAGSVEPETNAAPSE